MPDPMLLPPVRFTLEVAAADLTELPAVTNALLREILDAPNASAWIVGSVKGNGVAERVGPAECTQRSPSHSL